MVSRDELIRGLTMFGRRSIQDLVVESREMTDAITYLRVEFCLELVRASTFRTTDSQTFEKQDPLAGLGIAGGGQG